MAEGGGGPDEDSGDAMLAGVTTTTTVNTAGITLSQQHQPLNLKAAEVSLFNLSLTYNFRKSITLEVFEHNYTFYILNRAMIFKNLIIYFIISSPI